MVRKEAWYQASLNVHFIRLLMENILFLRPYIAIIQCKGYGEIMLGYQPTYGLQILSVSRGYFVCPWGHINGLCNQHIDTYSSINVLMAQTMYRLSATFGCLSAMKWKNSQEGRAHAQHASHYSSFVVATNWYPVKIIGNLDRKNRIALLCQNCTAWHTLWAKLVSPFCYFNVTEFCTRFWNLH